MKKINWKKRTMHRILAGALTLILLTAGMSSSICAAEAGPVSEAQEQAAQEYMTEDLYTLQAGDEDASISEAEDIENTISEDQDMEADPAEDYVSASTSEGAVDDTNTEVEETVETEAPPETCFEETGENHVKMSKSDKIDKVLTHRVFGLLIFAAILFLVFHLTFSENLFFLGGLFSEVAPSLEGTIILWFHVIHDGFPHCAIYTSRQSCPVA